MFVTYVCPCLCAEESQVVISQCHEGDKMYAICSYVAENEESLNLVEGERVYILGELTYLVKIGAHLTHSLAHSKL
jgi:hypothetical protein